jgi:hypothetical protein
MQDITETFSPISSTLREDVLRGMNHGINPVEIDIGFMGGERNPMMDHGV